LVNTTRLDSARRRLVPRRIAVLSIHTSPLDQPGTGDAGGMNVYVVETARRLAESGVEVEIFTRATSSALPPTVETSPGVTVRHVTAGPFEGLLKQDLPGQLCAVTAGVMRAEAARPEGWFDLVHSHYWLSGQVGWLSKERWNVPLVHSMHTMAKVKNRDLAAGDRPEPTMRVIGEEQVVAASDRLIANTADEARELVALYGADPFDVDVVHPGVDLELFRPGSRAAARTAHSLPPDAVVLLFVGRIQPLKAPDWHPRRPSWSPRPPSASAPRGRDLRRPVRERSRPADALADLPVPGIPTSCASSRRGPATLADWYGPPTSSSCPTQSPRPGRRRGPPAGRRWWRPPRGSAPRSPTTSAASSTAMIHVTSRAPSRRSLRSLAAA
jgi:hypothetical protein